LYEIMGQSV